MVKEREENMKALLLNGSPRKGNTCAALDALKRGMENISGAEIREVAAAEVSVSGCIACEQCADAGKCVFDDDANWIVDAVVEADVVVFATPVYWWGVTAQLKLIIDKLYSQGSRLKECSKKVGIIVIGEAAQDDPQYEIIARQFECICDYLGWDIAFCSTHTAGAADELAGNAAAMAEMKGLWKTLA